MDEPPQAPEIPPEVEEWLWAERIAEAQQWGPLSDIRWSAEECLDAGDAATARWLAIEDRRLELLTEWTHAAEQIARWEAVQMRLLAQALDDALVDARGDADMAVRSAAAELATAVGLSDRTVQRRMSDASTMRDSFPATLEGLTHGRFSRAHAQTVMEEGTRLDEAGRAAYEQIVLDLAPQLTTGRLRVAARAIAERLQPTALVERHAQARDERRVVVRDGDDGMAELWALLPAVLAHGIHDRVTRLAHVIRAGAARESPSDGDLASDPDDRTIDQLRADILCDLALTGHATGAESERGGPTGSNAVRAVVQITVPVLTLIGAHGDGAGAGTGDIGGATLNGRCPVTPADARRLAGGATMWDRVLTDPISGDVSAVDRRLPTEAQRRHLRARDEHCRFPGCRISVGRSDIDHTIDHQYGGATAVDNLAHLCRRHHSLKHHSAWTVTQKTPGVLVWTSPLGRTYTDRPPPALRFMPGGAGLRGAALFQGP
ncbi:hypothetical protein CVS47_03057 [Microbacterium lemovicicum]|uniref:HNH nuclease domain-containing protein n=1 Tax=Microbacterium lemovicicum TaxID=1072463 RepID=A0A3Q9J5Q9_9MICO|nr:HNH endonuclease signature motif containing protein [Microbacterium lemovicicum]AZS38400.1 hypothetical protein CVS47_03057 [Microbacterium lemovicicum]